MPARVAAATAGGAPLGGSTRARADPKRRIGNGNAVARGVDLTRVGVISDRELAFFHRLAQAGANCSEQQQHDEARRREEERRRALSKGHAANWPDTIEARHDQFLKSQQEAKDAAAERQRILDDLYAEQVKETRQAVLAQQELQQLQENSRGHNARSMKLLHETLQVRAEQAAFKQHCKQQEAAATQDTLRELQVQAWGDQAEALHKKLQARERNIAEKNANLETVLYQIHQRREKRAAEKQERVRVDQEAAEEKLEKADEEAERRAREEENGAYNVSHSRSAVTKAQRLQEQVAESVKDEAALRKEQEKVDSAKQWVADKREKKLAATEKSKQAGMQRYAEEAAPEKAPTYRTQDVFEQKGQSFLQRMHDGDVARLQKQQQHKRRLQQQREEEEQRAAAAQPRQQGTENGAGTTSGSGAMKQAHKAATRPGGFLDEAEEMAYAAEMRKYPEQLKAQHAKEVAARRAEAQRVEETQKLQAAEKRENARRAVEARRDEARQQQETRAAEDARYAAYIDSVLPPDMDPHLYRKAQQLS